MAVGQLFGEDLYTVMSNAGVLIFVITILLLMAEVDKDIIATHDVACFLVQVAQKGDQIRVSGSTVTPIQQPNDNSFQEEEKRPEGDILAENGTDGAGHDANGVEAAHNKNGPNQRTKINEAKLGSLLPGVIDSKGEGSAVHASTLSTDSEAAFTAFENKFFKVEVGNEETAQV